MGNIRRSSEQARYRGPDIIPRLQYVGQGFSFLRDAFDMLYQEGATQPKMMTVGLHMRLAGHPARAMDLQRFLDHVMKRKDVRVIRRIDIANHWRQTHPYVGG